MSNSTRQKQGPDPGQRTIFDYAQEGASFDALPEQERKHVLQADKDKDSRDAFAEIRADQLFAEAAVVLAELLGDENPKTRLGAACEIFRLRAVTLKANKKRQTAEKIAKAIDDGFRFS